MNPRIYMAALVLCLSGCPQPQQPDALHTSKSGQTAMAALSPVSSAALSPVSRAASEAQTSPMAANAVAYVPGDIDGDRKSDLLLDNTSLALSAYWLMDGGTVRSYSPAFIKPDGYTQAASGDFNGDGKLDIVWTRTFDRSLLMWVGDGNGFSQVPIRNYVEGWAVTGAGDIDGDGKSDLLLANEAQGLFAYWIMDGAAPTRYSPAFGRPAEHAHAAYGDFNGDGRLDIVWDRASDRAVVMWIGDGNGFVQAPVGQRAAGWEISGAGDVDGDGRSDLLLFNGTRQTRFSSIGQKMFAYWIMNGATPVRYSPPFFLPSTHVPARVGDYNGDGKLDIALVDEARTLLMLLGDGNGFREHFPLLKYSSGWQLLRGFGGPGYRLRPSYVRGDVDGDGKSDLLLFGLNNGPAAPSAPGSYISYLMDGPLVRSISPTSELGCTTAKPLATGDFNADGVLDLVFERDCGARETIMRLSAGGAFTDAAIPNPAPGWSIIGAGRYDNFERSALLLGQNVMADGSMDAVAFWNMDGSKVQSYSAGFLAPAGHKRLVAKIKLFDTARTSLVWAGIDGSGRQTLQFWEAIDTGFFSKPGYLPSPAAGWAVFGGGDIDGDGGDEVLLSKTSGERGIAYWTIEHAGSVRYSPGFAVPNSPYGVERIVTGDFNSDGNLDLVFPVTTSCGLRSCPDRMVMWIGDGSGFIDYDAGGYSSAYQLFNP